MFQRMVSGKGPKIGEEEAIALIGIRKELLRREITINMLISQIVKLEQDNKKLNKECEELTDDVILYFDLN